MTVICTQCQGETLKKQTPIEILKENCLIRFELVTTFVCQNCGKYYFDPDEWVKLIKQFELDNAVVTGSLIN